MSTDDPTVRSEVPHERQEPLYSAIASELVELTPETWQSVVLRVSVDRSQGGSFGMTHEISSPEGHREPIMPSDELFEMTHSLLMLFEEFGTPWTAITFNVRALPDEGWHFQCDYDYA